MSGKLYQFRQHENIKHNNQENIEEVQNLTSRFRKVQNLPFFFEPTSLQLQESVNWYIKKPANVSNCVWYECANYDVLTVQSCQYIHWFLRRVLTAATTVYNFSFY